MDGFGCYLVAGHLGCTPVLAAGPPGPLYLVVDPPGSTKTSQARPGTQAAGWLVHLALFLVLVLGSGSGSGSPVRFRSASWYSVVRTLAFNSKLRYEHVRSNKRVREVEYHDVS